MKTFSHLWQYLAYFLEWEMFQIKVVEKIKTHILRTVPFFRISLRLWDNVEKYGGTRGATNDVTIWCICVFQGYTFEHARTHTRARTHAYTQRNMYNSFAFPRQQLLRERVSVLLCTYLACPIIHFKSPWSSFYSVSWPDSPLVRCL
jgi:hypothetical protein